VRGGRLRVGRVTCGLGTHGGGYARRSGTRGLSPTLRRVGDNPPKPHHPTNRIIIECNGRAAVDTYLRVLSPLKLMFSSVLS